MEIRQLKHFVEVIRVESFTRAAENLFITQSALSRSIQALEDSLGGVLIDREGRRVKATALGHMVVEHAYRMLHEVDAIKRSVQLFQQGRQGRLRLGLGHTSGKVLMAPFASLMAREHPDAQFVALRGATDMQLEMLQACELDAVVAEQGAVLDNDELHVELLAELSSTLFCRVGHPLEGQRGLSFEEVTAYPVACTPTNSRQTREMIARYGPAGHPDRMRSVCSDDIDVLLQAVLNSDAIFWGTRISARELVEKGLLGEVHMENGFYPVSRQVLVTLVHRHKQPDPLLRLFSEFARVHLRD